jgi:hypothetical protein
VIGIAKFEIIVKGLSRQASPTPKPTAPEDVEGTMIFDAARRKPMPESQAPSEPKPIRWPALSATRGPSKGKEYKITKEVTLVGRKEILTVLAGRHRGKLDMSIVDAPEVIGFNESPMEGIRGKPNSSIVIGANLVKEGKAAAFVSAGNTGAVFASALVSLGKDSGAG